MFNNLIHACWNLKIQSSQKIFTKCSSHQQYHVMYVIHDPFQKACGEGSRKMKYETFIKVCCNFKPVFRHFFLENFPDPADWYQRRLAYTHSVSTNSIGKVTFL